MFLWFGCSSLYYFPTQQAYYVNPKKLNTPPEIIKFKTVDGIELEAWYFKSKEKTPKGLITHFHGNAQNVSTHFMYLWQAADMGYDYFVFDYRGFGNSQGIPNPKGVVSDGLAALQWSLDKMKERKISSLIVFCQSLGGAICMRALNLRPDINPDVLVIDSSFSSYRSVARTVARSSWLLWVLQPIAWLIVDNSEAPQDSLHLLKAKNYLVVHGDMDRVVAYSHGEKIYKLLPEPKEFWKIPGGGHADFLFTEEFKYRTQFYIWLQQKLSTKK